MSYDISVTSCEPQHAAVMERHVAHDGIGAFLGEAFGRIMGALAAQGLDVVGAPFARYDFSGDGFIVEAGFPTATSVAVSDGIRDIVLPGGDAAVTIHTGAYQDVASAYKALESWMAAHGYAPAGAPWETYLDGPEVAQPRTVVTWPCVAQTLG